MKITDIFIKRPVLAICLNVLILLAGYQAIRSLSVTQYPKSDSAIVKVRTAYIGAPANLVRGYISAPLERVIASADGIDYIESSSRQGLSEIIAHLRLNYDVNAALTQIQAKVAQVRSELPPEAESPIIEVESSDNRFASMYIGFASPDMEPNQLTEYLTRVVQPQLSTVSGVQRADVLGGRIFAMRVWLKADRMAALGISAADVKQALTRNNFLSAVGNTKGVLETTSLIVNTDLKSAEEFRQLIVARKGSTVIRLADIAEVVLGAESYDEDVLFNGKKATFMGVWVLPNANALDVIQAVRDVLPEIEKNLPSGTTLTVPYDATKYIQDAITDVLKTLIETIAIVIVVIYLFIGSFRSVLVPVVAIPLSLIGATAIMLAFGFTINLLTLLAVVLAVGLVVDDAIVMLENVERHVSEGMKPLEAALVAARELLGPTIAMTITLAAVYAPIAFQGGLTGALFKEFALTLSGAVIISGIVAITLSPMMSSKLVPQRGAAESGVKLWVDSHLARLKQWYEGALRKVLAFQDGVITFAICATILLVPLYMFSVKELAPREDQGVLFGIVQGPPQATLEQMQLSARQVFEAYQSVPEYRGAFQLTSPGMGFSGLVTKPWSERNRTIFEIEPELWAKVGGIPGARVIITTQPALPGGSDFPVELVISSTAEHDEVVGYAQQLVDAAFASGKFMFADTDLKYDYPRSEVVIDRDKANAMGMSLAAIGEDLATFVGGNYVNRFSIQGKSYRVIPQVQRSERLNPEQLLNLHVRGPNGTLIPLSTVAAVQSSVQPRQLNRFQQLNSAKIQGAIVPGVSLNDALSVLEQKAKEVLPSNYLVDYAGESRQLRRESKSMTSTLVLALIVIFLVLAAQFESFIDPLVILAGSVPLALAGALVFVFLGSTSLNIYSQVGLVTLVGLIAKNAILIVEFANSQQECFGMAKGEAVVQACITRLRPILMTSVATVVGHFPLVIATGAGAAARNSIGITLVTGMIIGTVFTLFVVPVLYVSISKPKLVHDRSH
ncbi:MAG: efflux RND transporter permease subunit [Pseudomonadota bacterium]